MATFSNQATLRYNGNVVNSNITTGELLEVLAASKTAVINNYSQGSEITYVINIVNSGTVNFTGSYCCIGLVLGINSSRPDCSSK